MAVPRSEYLSSVWRDGIFNDRVVFVTGGAGTICSAQTRALVSLGCNACIIGRNPSKTESAAASIAQCRPGAKVIGLGNVDVRSPDSLSQAAARCVSELGGIDFVIAGAAGNFVAPLSALSPNGFKAVIDIDVLGTFNTCKATLPYLVESAKQYSGQGGRLLAISATFHYTGLPLQAHVASAKAGVDALMHSISLEYGPLGVTANVIAPGAIGGTEGMARLASSESLAQKAMVKAIPLGKLGTVKDIADATVYLFSDAGAYVNGHTLVVDGAAWRRQGATAVGIDPGMQYPNFLLDGKISDNVKTGREGSSKL
ncbi:uncharacterized protein MKZ38_000397 [Zalerion maritima]|uniref:2,4-dienoyl-CoA reductase [(3E)-enoyl-CoA-producing] n=1 Tax=Zalerion maritima TaxID=339359 RepID=A0AAD5RRM7_9PEZI|nr:uncharacterized protein MKZ38_000397 [Zalerion maritima]